MTKAEDLCANMPKEIRPYATELAENVFFQCAKLVETRKGLTKQAVVIAYDNGGGQKGIRKNPAFEAYNQLMANYRKSLQQLTELLKEYGAVDMSDEDNPLRRILAEAQRALDA